MKALVSMLLALSALNGAEIAVLHSGARMRADRIERIDQRMVLHQGGGRIELDAALVERIEMEDEPAADLPPQPIEPPPGPPPAKSPREPVTEAARRYGLPPEFVHSVAATESAYRVNAVSPKGAIGVMQLMPGTARMLSADPHVLEENIDAGTRLLRDLLLRFEGDPNPVRRALAAYNAGEGAVRKYNGVPPYRETQAYVEKVLDRYWKQQARPARPRPPGGSAKVRAFRYKMGSTCGAHCWDWFAWPSVRKPPDRTRSNSTRMCGPSSLTGVSPVTAR